MKFLVYALLVVGFVTAERRFARVARPFPRRGFATDLLYIPVQVGLRIAVNGTLAVGATEMGRALLPPSMLGLIANRPTWLQAIVLILVIDAVFYGLHRAKHRYRWWWRLHETHHSSVDLDWLSSVRFHPLERALDRVIYLAPLMLLGPSDGALLAWAIADAFFGMFVHANLPIRLGPLIYLVNGPELHHWHHAPPPDGQRCNYGNNLSVFDWLFGTAYHPASFPDRFGTDDPDYPQDDFLRQLAYAFRPAALGTGDARLSRAGDRVAPGP